MDISTIILSILGGAVGLFVAGFCFGMFDRIVWPSADSFKELGMVALVMVALFSWLGGAGAWASLMVFNNDFLNNHIAIGILGLVMGVFLVLIIPGVGYIYAKRVTFERKDNFDRSTWAEVEKFL